MTGNGKVSDMYTYRVIRHRPGESDSFYDVTARDWSQALMMVAQAIAKASDMTGNRVEAITDIQIVRKP